MLRTLAMALCALFFITAPPALADDDDRRGRGHQWHGDHDDDRHWQRQSHGKHKKLHKHAKRHKDWKHHKHWKHHRHAKRHKAHRHGDVVRWHGERRWDPGDGHYHGRKFHRHRHVHGHGHRHAHGRGHKHYKGRGLGHVKHHGHGHKHRHDKRRVRHDDWALYAILALQIVDVLNESQRDSFARAQKRAVNQPIGETIRWHDGGARGSVVPTREGSDTAGRYCREFQQRVVIGNRSQSGYGIACRQPGGDWEIVS